MIKPILATYGMYTLAIYHNTEVPPYTLCYGRVVKAMDS